MLHRLSGVIEDPIELPFRSWPLDTYHVDKFDMYFNGESIQLRHQPNAHTDGDSIVYFRRSDVIATGDVYLTTSYPFIDVVRGGSLQGIIDALNELLDLMIPDRNEEGGTLAISGHGAISDEYEVVNYRDMLTIIRDRVVAFIEMGMTLEEVKAAQAHVRLRRPLRHRLSALVHGAVHRNHLPGVRRMNRPVVGCCERLFRRTSVLLAVLGIACSVPAAHAQFGAGGAPPERASGPRGGCIRPDRNLGFHRQRGLAAPHDDGAKGRLRKPAVDGSRTCAGR